MSSVLWLCLCVLLIICTASGRKSGDEDDDHHDDEQHHGDDDHHDDHHEEEHHNSLDGAHELLEKFGEEGSHTLTHEQYEQMYASVFNVTTSGHDGHGGHGGDDHDDHDEEHDDHRRRNESNNSTHDEDHHDEDHHDDDDDEHHDEEHNHEHELSNATCLSVDGVAHEAQVDVELPIDEAGIIRSSAVMLVMSWRGCVSYFRAAQAGCNNAQTTPAQAWGWGFLSVVIISLFSLAGVTLIPVKEGTRGTKILLEVLVSFAVGTLMGDVVFHILPNLTGVHSHGAASDVDPVWYLAAVSGSVWLFFIVERVILQLANVQSHEENAEHGVFASGRAHTLSHEVVYKRPEPPSNDDLGLGGAKGEAEIIDDLVNPKKAAGYLNLIADGFHNFTDGLALGAAWSASISLGFGTSIAVMFHEIPQELGDFAILINSGFTKKQALLLNFASALVSIVGLIIGVAIGTNSASANGWILAFSSGGFIYIAIAEMIPELLKQRGNNHTALQLSGLVVGMLAMLLLGIYEEDLQAALCSIGA